jgi:hypothetical protein
MSTALKSALKPETAHPYLRSTAEQNRRRIETRRTQLQSRVSPLVNPPRPLWLSTCFLLRHLSTTSALVLGATLLPIYGWSVLSQHQWGTAYGQLVNLQQQEQRLQANIELRKYKVAEQAELQPAGLVPQAPANLLFLSPAATRSLPATPAQPASVLPVVPLSPVSY